MPLSRLRRPLFLALSAYALLLCALRSLGAFEPPGPGAAWPARGVPVEVRARLGSAPRPGRREARALLQAESIDGRPSDWPVLALFRAGAGPAPEPGSVLLIRGRLRRPRAPRAPGEFDERAHLRDRGASLVLHADSWRTLALSPSGAARLLRRAEAARRAVHAHLARAYPPPERAVLRGILLGDKGGLDPALALAMKELGAYHLIVPSGTNVSFVLAFSLWLCAGLRLPGPARLALPLAAAGFYGLMVGADPPYLRAYLCAALCAAGRALDREADLFQALTLSALLLLLWDPRLLFHRGFQMSYLVVLALAVAEPQELPPLGWPRPARRALGLLAVGATAQLALLPVLSRMGGVLSPLGVLANLALVPLSGLLLGAGYAAWGLSLLPPGSPGEACAALTGLLARAFRGLCLSGAALPFPRAALAPMPAARALGYYLALLGLLSWRSRRAAIALTLLGSALMLASAG